MTCLQRSAPYRSRYDAAVPESLQARFIAPIIPQQMGIYDYSARTIGDEQQPLSLYGGQVLLIVNVASQCGFTGQYAGLEELYRKFHDRGFSVLGFPCNQFGHQEPGDEAQISAFCTLTYAVTFPMFAKIKVNGADAHPLYRYLKQARPGVLGFEAIKWNFTKFLVNAHGEPLRRFAPADTPMSIQTQIAAQLPDASAAVPPPQ